MGCCLKMLSEKYLRDLGTLVMVDNPHQQVNTYRPEIREDKYIYSRSKRKTERKEFDSTGRKKKSGFYMLRKALGDFSVCI